MENLKALVGNIQKFSIEDGPGIRTTVFLKGCPLSCRWCHNPELIEYEQQMIHIPGNCIKCGACAEVCGAGAAFIKEEQLIVDFSKCERCLKCAEVCYAKALHAVARWMTVEEVVAQIAQDKQFYGHTGGGATISGGEMLSQPAFVNTLVDRCKELEIHVCLDTSGYGDGETLLHLAQKENVSHILYDMKCIDSGIHREYTGKDNLLILDNLKRLAASLAKEKIIMRMPLIKGVSDTPEIISKTGELYRKLGLKKLTLICYHNLGVSKGRNIGKTPQAFEPPTTGRVAEIKEYFASVIGMEVEVLGGI